MATKKVKKASIQQNIDNLKSRVGNLNNEVIHLTDNAVEATLTTGAKWQTLMTKVLKSGTNLLDKQQDLVFDTLEELKGQYTSGNKRFRKLVGLGTTKAKKVATKKVEQKVKAIDTKAIKAAYAKSDNVQAKDDLKQIEGIGPKVETLLNQAGINTFDQLSKATVKNIKTILEGAGPRFKSLNPNTWKQQAKAAAKK